ncbi:hypothetical protein, partial [Exiguobacterium sp. 8A]|uniref:hypothetical protein n=1 Tax=Exiguobacterium sp. 8A TaxID=2653139 RepID=UPI00191604D0
ILDGRKHAGMPMLKTGTSKTRNLTQVSGLVLRHVGVEMRGKTTDRMAFRNNVLLDGEPGTDYLLVTHGSHTVERNILLREKGQAGRGIVTYKTHDSAIRHNHIGDLSRRALLESKVPGMRTVYGKVDELRRRKVLTTTRTGDFVTGINVLNGDERLTISRNLVHGERTVYARTDDGQAQRRDHVLYAKGYDGMRIEGNLFQGWANDPTGGVKVRNGNGASIVSNVFDDVGLLLYVYGDYPDKKDWRLTDTLVLDNLYIGRTNAGKWGTGFSYTQDFHNAGEERTTVRDNLFAHNVFRVRPEDRVLIDERRLGMKTKEAFALYANRLENGKPIPGGMLNVTDRQHRLIRQAIDPLARPLPRLAD